MKSLSQFDPVAPETVECPYPFYAAMREDSPVYEVPKMGFHIVASYDLIQEVLADPATYSSQSGPGLQFLDEKDEELTAILRDSYPQRDTLLTLDPPEHKRFRSLVNRAFSARRVAGMEDGIRAIASELIDEFLSEPRDGSGAVSVEFVSQFAVPLPLTVIADALGVSRNDMADFKRWSDDAVAPLGGMISRERRLECARSQVEFQQYFAAQLAERRAAPRDDILSDLISAHVATPDAEDQPYRALDTAEMLSILNQILVAGNETTANMLGSALLLLLEHPQQMDALRADPAQIGRMVEESLRLESPVQGLFRLTTRETKLGDVDLPSGARLVLMYASGNRDACQFSEPEAFQLDRDEPTTHLAFGRGEHFCLGAALARLEGSIAFEELLRRTQSIRLAAKNDGTHTPSFILRGLRELHVEVEPA